MLVGTPDISGVPELQQNIGTNLWLSELFLANLLNAFGYLSKMQPFAFTTLPGFPGLPRLFIYSLFFYYYGPKILLRKQFFRLFGFFRTSIPFYKFLGLFLLTFSKYGKNPLIISSL